MAKDWDEMTDDDLLNTSGSSQSAEVIARYQRIMDKKTINALMEVRAGLFDVKKSMHLVTDKLVERILSVENLQKKSAKSQGRLQIVTIVLTIVIAISTVAYTWITWQTVKEQREANAIQREMMNQNKVKNPSNNALQPTQKPRG